MLSLCESFMGYVRAGTMGTLGGFAGSISSDQDYSRYLEARTILDAQRGIDPLQSYINNSRASRGMAMSSLAAAVPIYGAIPAMWAYRQRRKAERELGI